MAAERRRQEDLWRAWELRWRDALLWLVCLGVIAKEGFFGDPPNLGLIGAMVGVMGVPLVARRDERERRENEE